MKKGEGMGIENSTPPPVGGFSYKFESLDFLKINGPTRGAENLGGHLALC